jgi:hypothetical protein
MLVDAFQVTDEFDVISFRIQYLHSLVDKVIVAESSLTHAGADKPLYFSEWLPSLESKYREKIEVVIVPLTKNMTTWQRETFTREFIVKHLRLFYQNEKYILSDVDEIPSVDQVEELLKSSGTFHFHTPTFFRKLNWMLADNHKYWSRGIMGEVNLAVFENGGRYEKIIPKIGGKPGAHFSYLGFDAKKLVNKLSNFAHHEEFSSEHWQTKDTLAYCNHYKIDHLGRSRVKGFGVLEIIDSKENLVVSAAKQILPDLYDYDSNQIKYKQRALASAKLTAYVSKSKISKISQKFFSIDTFLKETKLSIVLLTYLELIISFLTYTYHDLKHKIKD